MRGVSEPTGRHSITMARDIAEAARVRGDPSGPYGLSACIASAVARQIDRDNLDELIQAAKGARGARPALGLLPSHGGVGRAVSGSLRHLFARDGTVVGAA
jgi:hypothetical protein